MTRKKRTTAIPKLGPSAAAESPAMIDEMREVRVASLIEEFQHFPQYEEEKYLRRFAAKHKNSLLERRDEILSECRHRCSDQKLLVLLKARSPATYRRMQRDVRALAFAEELDVEEGVEARTPPRETDAQCRDRVVNSYVQRAQDERELARKLGAEGLEEDDIERCVMQYRRDQEEQDERQRGGDGVVLS